MDSLSGTASILKPLTFAYAGLDFGSSPDYSSLGGPKDATVASSPEFYAACSDVSIAEIQCGTTAISLFKINSYT